MDEELLISVVANYKQLYDPKHQHYDDNQRRNIIWEEIGGIIKQPAQESRNRWKRIRDNYRRAKKLRKSKSREGAKHFKTPKYDMLLTFLAPYIDSETETDSNLPPDDDDTYSSVNVFEEGTLQTKENNTYKIHTDTFIDIDEELLISVVANYKELYDPKHQHYDDIKWRNIIWEEIGGIIKQPAQECRKRWRRVRDNYRRAKKLRKSKSREGAKNCKTPKYDKLLSFLKPYIDSETETDLNLPPVDSPSTDADDTCSSVYVFEDCTSQAKKDNKRSSSEVSESSAEHDLFQNFIEKKYIMHKEPDRISDFFQNLGETVKTFPENIQIRVKRDVYKLISEAEEEVYLIKKSNESQLS